jgi:hypothetical protein
MSFSAVSVFCVATLQGLLTNRTQLIRDVALAFGKTCIACGREAVSRVGSYPVCVRHRTTVELPDPNWKWKKNVRTRHADGSAREPARGVAAGVV